MSERQPLVPKEGIMDKVVNSKQLSKWPTSTLIMARCFKILVWTIVALAIWGLIANYLKGKIGVSSSTSKEVVLPLPKVVLCPVWGQKSMSLKIKSATVGNLMTQDYTQWKETTVEQAPCEPFEYYKFDESFGALSKPRIVVADQLKEIDGLGCVCVNVQKPLANHDIGKDFVRLSFFAGFAEDIAKQLAIGFSAGHNEYPADWAYIDLQKRSIGDVTMQRFNYGSAPWTGGTTISQYRFNLKTSYPVLPAQQVGGDSEVVLAFASYMITSTSDVNNIFSAAAMVFFCGLFLATLAALHTFSLLFPDEQDPAAPKPIEPAWFLQDIFGQCCSCFRKKDDAV